MTALVEFEVRGADLVSRLFGRTAHRIEDPRPGLREIADYLRVVEREQFASRGKGKWTPLRPGTIRQKGSSTPLVASGALMRSLTAKRGRGRKSRVTKSGLVFGTSLYYARFVSKRRPVIDLSRSNARRMAQIMGRYVVHD